MGDPSPHEQAQSGKQCWPKCAEVPAAAFQSLTQVIGLASFLLTMSQTRSRLESHLPHLLLVIAVAEMAIYRLLVPGLRSRVDMRPPLWHSTMAYVGLFLFYFASALAVAVVAHQLWEISKSRRDHAFALSWIGLPAGLVFLALASLSIVAAPSAGVTFLLEGAFVAVVLTIASAQLTQKGDIGARLGLILLAVPLVVHFYAPLSVRYIAGEEALWNGLTDSVEDAGRWLVLLAALTMPYCFGARPFLLRAARIGPLLAALAVGLLGAMLVRHDFVKGMELAQNGLGFAVGPGAPSSYIALCLLALSAVAWTFAGCFSAPSASRRTIGVGIALVVVGGYGFAWPLQYLVGLAGLLAISKAAGTVEAEERAAIAPPRVPPIADEAWQRYMESVLRLMRAENSELGEHSTQQGAVVTVRGEGGQSRSHFVCKRQGMPVTVTVERISGSIVGLDVRCGEGTVDGAPTWSVHSQKESAVGIVHPMPPACSGTVYEEGGEDFRERFYILDTARWSDSLLDDSTRERMLELVHGWIACWPSGTLRFQVYPGRGAPLDRPIPISALAFETGEDSPKGLVQLLDLLVTLAQRTHDLAAE